MSAKPQSRAHRSAPLQCPDGVRIATRTDAPALYELILNGVVREVSLAPVNQQKVAEMVSYVTNPAAPAPRSVVAVIDGKDGKPVAAAPLLPRQWWYSDDWHYIQPWIFVHEDHRKSPFSKMLIETMLWWADRTGYPILMNVPESENSTQRREVYGRYAEEFGGSFIHSGSNQVITPKPFNTRIATPNDYHAVRDLCLALHAENGSAPLDEAKMDAVLSQALQHQGGIIALVTDATDTPVGCACLALTQWDYSLSWHYSEMWVFIKKEHRSKSYARDLIDFCKWWSEQTAVPVTLGIMSKDRTRAKMRLYGQWLKPLEYFFLYDPRAKGA